jgi:hypothetical protein
LGWSLDERGQSEVVLLSRAKLVLLEDVLGSGVVDLEVSGRLLDSHLKNLYLVDKLLSLLGLYRNITSLAF